MTFADPARPHQLRLYLVGVDIAVSCNCLRGPRSKSQCSPIEVRGRWEAAEAIGVYRSWHRRAWCERAGVSFEPVRGTP